MTPAGLARGVSVCPGAREQGTVKKVSLQLKRSIKSSSGAPRKGEDEEQEGLRGPELC